MSDSDHSMVHNLEDSHQSNLEKNYILESAGFRGDSQKSSGSHNSEFNPGQDGYPVNCIIL